MTTITSTSTISVFDIYLIQSQICANLTPRDLRRCCLVSRDFYQNFTPFLYQTITITRSATYNKFTRVESLQALHRYRQHVSQVTCVFARIWKILLDQQCYNLKVIKSLSLPKRPQNQEINKLQIPYFTNLVRACPDLQEVECDHFWFEEPIVQYFCRVIRNHEGLRELKISNFRAYMWFKHARLFLWSSLKLERFYLGNMRTTYQTRRLTPEEIQEFIDLTGEKDPIFRVRDLALAFRLYDNVSDALHHYLKRCPHLEQFAVPDHCFGRVDTNLGKVISENFPNLQHLDVRMTLTTEAAVDELILACNNLRSFAGHPKQVSTNRMVTALLKHRESLEKLYLDGGCKITSKQIQSILSSFPKLLVFDAMGPYSKIDNSLEKQTLEGRGDPILNPIDMENDARPWICHNLRVLKLRFMHEIYQSNDHGGDDVHEQMGVFPAVFYEQIGQMRELEVLWLGRIERRIPDLNAMIRQLASITGTAESHSVDCELELPLGQARIEDMTKGIRELERLEKLEELELRNFGRYISWNAIWGAKSSSWHRMKKLHYT
ncbi:hypothetical protein BGZ46_003108 [Entomortierella lignicola]|nr:hypothetical protein BGZ46_003108 [Entomortierella lignicola]